MQRVVNLSKLDKRDFSGKEYYPGTEGNPFDSILRIFNNINRVKPIIFFLGITFVSFLLTFLNIRNGLFLLLFATLDWLIIAFLPKLKITFGPPQSQVFLLLIMRVPFIWLPYPYNLILQIIGTILVLVGFVYEPSQLIVKQQELLVEAINPFDDIHFVQMGDLHLERSGIREHKLLKTLTSLRPSFILFTGDFLNLSNNEDQDSINEVSDLFNEINEISRTFFVPGSPAVDLAKSLKDIVSNTSATSLINKVQSIHLNDVDIQIIGLDCTHKPSEDIANLESLYSKNAGVNILMYHAPDLVFELNDENDFDLMLSGHTHGGQVRIPLFGAIFTGSLYGRKLQSGSYRMGKTLLSISRGIGFEGMGAPRVRFLCKPEIINWTIKHKPALPLPSDISP